MTARGLKPPTLATVTTGGKVVGFMLDRGPAGTEAWTAGEKSLGLFMTLRPPTRRSSRRCGHDDDRPDLAERVDGGDRHRHRARRGHARHDRLHRHGCREGAGRVPDHDRRGRGDYGHDVGADELADMR